MTLVSSTFNITITVKAGVMPFTQIELKNAGKAQPQKVEIQPLRHVSDPSFIK